jgi:4-amino-4-deoxy-L-arabinose transferase-like glycosyltransferase
MYNSDLIVGIITLSVTAIFYFFTRDLSKLSVIYVNYVLLALGTLSLLCLIKAMVRPERITFFETAVERNNIIVGLTILFAYLLLLPVIGFLPASYLFFLIMTLYLSEERFSTSNILISAAVTFVVVSVFYGVFKHVLLVPLPEGFFFTEYP